MEGYQPGHPHEGKASKTQCRLGRGGFERLLDDDAWISPHFRGSKLRSTTIQIRAWRGPPETAVYVLPFWWRSHYGCELDSTHSEYQTVQDAGS